jgi:hypothetical protein
VCAACVKNSVRIFIEKIYKMKCLEGSGVPLLYPFATECHIYIYICRTAPLTSRRYILNTVFIQQISVLNILNMLHNLRIPLFKTPSIS